MTVAPAFDSTLPRLVMSGSQLSIAVIPQRVGFAAPGAASGHQNQGVVAAGRDLTWCRCSVIVVVLVALGMEKAVGFYMFLHGLTINHGGL